jgi:hypothetical protein
MRTLDKNHWVDNGEIKGGIFMTMSSETMDMSGHKRSTCERTDNTAEELLMIQPTYA